MHLDVGCLEARSVEPSGTLGRRESRASSGLYRGGDTRVLIVDPGVISVFHGGEPRSRPIGWPCSGAAE
eukprot:5386885-Prymnesium_polylepis.1